MVQPYHKKFRHKRSLRCFLLHRQIYFIVRISVTYCKNTQFIETISSFTKFIIESTLQKYMSKYSSFYDSNEAKQYIRRMRQRDFVSNYVDSASY